MSNKFEKVGNLIKWHSIKLPANRSNSLLLTESLILDFAIADSVLKKFPLESLILFGRPNMEIRLDYFNRVSICLICTFYFVLSKNWMRLVNTLSLIGYGWVVVGLATTPPLIKYTLNRVYPGEHGLHSLTNSTVQ